MNSQQYQLVKSIFMEACQRSHDDRAGFLREACGENTSLRQQVERLLDHDGVPVEALEPHRIRSSIAAATFERHATTSAPERIGRYRVHRRVGEGGMGVVYEAEQDAPRRTVALKLVGCGVAPEQALARFQTEMQLLARLQHPGIAQIFDAGTFETPFGQQPYFAMEFIQGEPLLTFVRSRNLSIRQRLQLFVLICDAVKHAHEKGVIHRDLKPSNILVHEPSNAAADSESEIGQPKILDFGVAVAVDADPHATMQTSAGQLVGTLSYMSPEQAVGDRGAIDTRSDVYALGVVLFQMLTDAFPYPIEGSLPDVVRSIQHSAPMRPSAANRLVDDEIDTIVLKCLQKEPQRRYQSAGELGMDVRRYLAGRPILAKADSRAYVWRKTLRRHWIGASVAGSFLLLIIASLVVVLGMWQTASDALETSKREHRRAVDESQKALAVNQFLQQMLSSADPKSAQGREVSIREALDHAARILRTGPFKDQPAIEASVRMTIGEAYTSLGRFDEADEHLQAAHALREQHFGPVHLETAASLNSLAVLRRKQGQWEQSVEMRKRVLDVLSQLDQNRSALAAKAMLGLAYTYQSMNRLPEAEAAARTALEIEQQLHGPASAETARAKIALATIFHQPQESEQLLQEALATEREVLGPNHPEIPETLRSLAHMQHMKRDLPGAEQSYLQALQLYQQIYGEQHHSVMTVVQDLTFLYNSMGQYERAAELLARYEQAARNGYGPSLELGEYLHSLAEATYMVDAQRAEPIMREALALQEMHDTGERWRTASAHVTLALILIKSNQYDDAEAILRQILDMNADALRPTHWLRTQARSMLGEVICLKGDYPAAEKTLLEAHEEFMAQRVPASQRINSARRLADLYERWNLAEPDKPRAQLAEQWRDRLQTLSAK